MIRVLDLEPIEPFRVEAEVSIPVLHVRKSRGPSERSRPSTISRLIDALRSMRAAGLEVDLYIRGSWRKRGNSPAVVLQGLKLESWAIRGGDLVSDGEPVSWLPVIGRTPRPEIVVRGVR